MTIPTDLRARAEALLKTADDEDGADVFTFSDAAISTIRGLLAALPAEKPRLTVGAAFRLTSVVEALDTDGVWRQFRRDEWSRFWRTDAAKWTTWGWPYEVTADDESLPCRLVPLADADRDPGERGPL